MLDTPISQLHGVGKKRLEILLSMGIATFGDLLYTAPKKYRDLKNPDALFYAHHGEDVVIEATVKSHPLLRRTRRNFSTVTFLIDDGSCQGQVIYFNQPYMSKNILKDQKYIFIGRIDARSGTKQIVNPSLEKIHEDLGVKAYYPMGKGISQRAFRNLIQRALSETHGKVTDPLPTSFRSRYQLPEINYTLQHLHVPDSMDEAKQARARLAFEEMLYFMAALRSVREARKHIRGLAFHIKDDDRERFLSSLPFALTNAQQRTLHEIEQDLASGGVMNRLVQGDVGSGKTAVAMAALYYAKQNGTQAVMMAPTEILAKQHFDDLTAHLEPLGVRCAMLTGSTPAAEAKAIRYQIADGDVDVIVGTHALFQKGVHYKHLGLAITDEQHRFGVRQRAALQQKGQSPHLLVMSATPVPRTLALIIYGDLDVSIIDELPPGRKVVHTRLVSQDKRKAMYDYLHQQLLGGQQAYLVCPLVEESDKLDVLSATELYEELQKGIFSDIPMALVHGRMKEDEKQAAIQAFSQGKVKALVSTTVIEVGVNVPTATIMVIENAERFGLSQLHQLRGRVGRGRKQSWCFLSSKDAGELANQRLKIMAKENDGFKIAEKDLELRGPGEFLGTRQSGMIDGRVLAMMSDVKLIAKVRSAMDEITESPELQDEKDQIFAAAYSRYQSLINEIVLN